MLKIYFILALIYAILKTFNSGEQVPIRIGGYFIKQLFLFPYLAIVDIVGVFTKENTTTGRRR